MHSLILKYQVNIYFDYWYYIALAKLFER